MESIYWVVSRDCNQKCPHCYNNSGPGEPGLTLEEIDRCVDHLPDPAEVGVERIILSGGEVLVWPELLFRTLARLDEKYRGSAEVWVQTNGDKLDVETLDKLLDHGVRRVDIASMDKFHRKGSLTARERIENLFTDAGMLPVDVEGGDSGGKDVPEGAITYAFWGATEDEWIGPLWPRGRAMQKGLVKAKPADRFCSIWSGAKGFLDYTEPGSEVNIQLADVYPCCQMTCRPLGSLLDEPLLAMLDRCRESPVMRALNAGRPEAMGETFGVTAEQGEQRTQELGNHCLWCDEFFAKHAPDLLHQGAVTERGVVDLVQIGAWPATESSL